MGGICRCLHSFGRRAGFSRFRLRWRIENNSLGIGQVTAILEGKRVNAGNSGGAQRHRVLRPVTDVAGGLGGGFSRCSWADDEGANGPRRNVSLGRSRHLPREQLSHMVPPADWVEPEEVGKVIRLLLGISWEQQITWSSADEALNAWSS